MAASPVIGTGTFPAGFPLSMPFIDAELPARQTDWPIPGEPDFSKWPTPGQPEPDLLKRGLTEARCVVRYFYGATGTTGTTDGTTDEKLDALDHLANICTQKALGRGSYYQPRPSGIVFRGNGSRYERWTSNATCKKDWEQSSSWRPNHRVNTQGWFKTMLPEHISRYGPEHVTRSELLELVRVKDQRLLHVCGALVQGMWDTSEKEARHEIPTEPLDEAKHEAKTATEPNYPATISEFVSDQQLRRALPEHLARTLEAVLRKDGVVKDAAKVLNMNERTVRKQMCSVRKILGAKFARESSERET